jgi:hypothetical protein
MKDVLEVLQSAEKQLGRIGKELDSIDMQNVEGEVKTQCERVKAVRDAVTHDIRQKQIQLLKTVSSVYWTVAPEREHYSDAFAQGNNTFRLTREGKIQLKFFNSWTSHTPEGVVEHSGFDPLSSCESFIYEIEDKLRRAQHAYEGDVSKMNELQGRLQRVMLAVV